MARRDAGRPRREMVRLLLLALEREEIVSVGYREAMIARRLATMPIGPRRAGADPHALNWAWKDEEMHAIYLRGAILRLGSRSLRARAYLRQVAGADRRLVQLGAAARPLAAGPRGPVARRRWSSRSGTLTGQVPRDVRQHLRYGPFRDFCLFNVDAELTARLCYDRMLDLAARADRAARRRSSTTSGASATTRTATPGSSPSWPRPSTSRTASCPASTPDDVAARIGAVGEVLPAPRDRADRHGRHPLGAGGRVWVAAGEIAPRRSGPLFRRLLDESGLASRLARARSAAWASRPGRCGWPSSRPSCSATTAKDRSIITDPELLARAGRLPPRAGLPTTWRSSRRRNIYDRFYAGRSVAEVARYFGFESPSYRLVDLSAEQVPHAYRRGMAQYTVGRTWKEADFRISFGKMRSHPVEMAYLTVGNVEWIGARCDEYLFPERQAHRETAIMMLLDDFPPALRAARRLRLGGRRPGRRHGLPAAARRRAGSTPRADALALDLVAARHMGGPGPARVAHPPGRPATGSATRAGGSRWSAWTSRSPAGAGRTTTNSRPC